MINLILVFALLLGIAVLLIGMIVMLIPQGGRSVFPVAVKSWEVDEKKKHLPEYCVVVRCKNGEEREFRGSCTVWHEYPSGNRAGTHIERWLSDREKSYQWGTLLVESQREGK